MLPGGSGDLYLYGVDKNDIRSAYRCRTQHRLHAKGYQHQLSSNSASIAVSGEIHFFFVKFQISRVFIQPLFFLNNSHQNL